MKASIKFVLLVFPMSLSLAGPEASKPSSYFRTELELWGIKSDGNLRIVPGPDLERGYSRAVIGSGPDTLREVYFEIDEQNVGATAQALAVGHDAAELESGLRANLANGHSIIPLSPFLPPRVLARYGTTDSHACYFAGLNFHEDGAAIFGDSLDRGMNLDEIRKRYSMLGYEDALKYGDILLFRRHGATPAQSPSFHLAVYIGGDILYHKYNPLQSYYEFTTFDSLANTYGNAVVGNFQRQVGMQSSFRGGEPFFIEFLRYDPMKLMPEARAKPKTITSSSSVSTPFLCASEVGRNAPCPCGSGKKFKKCCGFNGR